MNKHKAAWLLIVKFLSNKGIPLLFIRDPKTNTPSVSLTLTIVSFAFCILGLINKASHSQWFGNLDETHAFNLFIACSTLYFGRKLTGDKTTSDKDDPPSNTPPA